MTDPTRRLAAPQVAGRDVYEVHQGTITLPKPLTVACAEMKAWAAHRPRAALFLRPTTDGYHVFAYEEHGELLDKKQADEFRGQQADEAALAALAKLGGPR